MHVNKLKVGIMAKNKGPEDGKENPHALKSFYAKKNNVIRMDNMTPEERMIATGKDPNDPTLQRVIPSEAKRCVRTPADPITGCTAKEEAFAQAVARQGLSYSDAYRQSYNVGANTKVSTVHTSATNIRNKPRVASRILQIVEEIKKESSAKRFTRADRVLNTLEKIMEDESKPATARISAAKLLAQTVGALDRDEDDGPQSVEALESKLHELIRKPKAG